MNKYFIYEALILRFEKCIKFWRISEEYYEMFKNFAEMVGDCGINNNDTPSSIVDNRIINGYYWSFKYFIEENLIWNNENEEEKEKRIKIIKKPEEKRTKKEIKEINKELDNKGYLYDNIFYIFHE